MIQFDGSSQALGFFSRRGAIYLSGGRVVKVVERVASRKSEVVFLCDFSPPRGADPALLESARDLKADYICVAYSPGKSVRVDSVVTAYILRERFGQEVVFNLATRDMNKLALANHLLGAQMLGLENVVVVQGDSFTERDKGGMKASNDFRPTELIKAVKEMNQGLDFKGLKLRSPTDFCVGASMDLGKGVELEVSLAQAKVCAGADFFITQVLYDVGEIPGFFQEYRRAWGCDFPKPVFCGVQILDKDGVLFGEVPEGVRRELEAGRLGADIAVELLHQFVQAGIRTIYLVPPILKGGVRDYRAAQQVMEAFRG